MVVLSAAEMQILGINLVPEHVLFLPAVRNTHVHRFSPIVYCQKAVSIITQTEINRTGELSVSSR
jgi:hypothetical protein